MKKNTMLNSIASPSTRFWSDSFRLLLIHPEFQKDVVRIRWDFGVPERGFLKDMEGLKRWEREALGKTDSYTGSLSVKRKKQAINRDIRAHKLTLIEADKKLNEIACAAFLDAFKARIQGILKRFELPPSFEDGVRGYVKTGFKDTLLVSPKGYVVNIDFTDSKPSGISINVHKPLTREEWKLIKTHVEGLQSSVFNLEKAAMKPIRNLDRDLRLLDLSGVETLTSEELAARYWADEEIDFSEMKKRDRARALIVRQAKHRLLERLRTRFPSVTLS